MHRGRGAGHHSSSRASSPHRACRCADRARYPARSVQHRGRSAPELIHLVNRSARIGARSSCGRGRDHQPGRLATTIRRLTGWRCVRPVQVSGYASACSSSEADPSVGGIGRRRRVKLHRTIRPRLRTWTGPEQAFEATPPRRRGRFTESGHQRRTRSRPRQPDSVSPAAIPG